MLAQIVGSVPDSVWEKYGLTGLLLLTAVGAVGFVGRWLIKSKDRSEDRLVEVIREQHQAMTSIAVLTSKQTDILAQIASDLRDERGRVSAVEHGLEAGVNSSMAAHEKTHTLLEEAIGELREKPPRRTGRAHLGALFTLALGAGAVAVAEAPSHEERPGEQHVYNIPEFLALAHSYPP